MKTQSVTNIQPPEVEPARSVLCPGCGYDLRATAGERCSECGLVLDREALRRSGFPWAHRKEIGRVRAFWKTVWLVTIDSKTLRYEAAKQQSPPDAPMFRRWVAAVLAVCFAGGVILFIRISGDVELAVDNAALFMPSAQGSPDDLLVPWSAGITIRPMLFVYGCAFAVYVASAPRMILRAAGKPDDYRRAVEAMGDYVVGPLVFLVPATAGYATLFWLKSPDHHVLRTLPISPILVTVIVLLALVAIGGTVHRTGQWRARTAHAGYATGFLGMFELLVRWAVGGVVLLGVVPWCVGFVWIVVDSFLD